MPVYRSKLPPYGKSLAERLRHSNPPYLVVVCIGLDAWERAKVWSKSPNDIVPLVQPHDVPPKALNWPVCGLNVIIDWDIGPSTDQVIELCQALLLQGATTATVRPLFDGECIRIYHGRNLSDVA